MDKMRKYADGIYFMEFDDGARLFMTGIEYDFRRYNVKNTNKFLKHFNMTDKKIAKTRQKHTKNIIVNPHPGEYVAIDGFVTDDTPVMIVTADCIPILIRNECTKRAALLHSGWRGVEKRIYIEVLRHMGNVKDLTVYMLPSIQKKSFEVGEDFVREFDGRYRFRSFLSAQKANGKYHFDLQKFVKKELIDAGISPCNIHLSTHDTFTSTRFHSYRREGKTYGLNAIVYVI